MLSWSVILSGSDEPQAGPGSGSDTLCAGRAWGLAGSTTSRRCADGEGKDGRCGRAVLGEGRPLGRAGEGRPGLCAELDERERRRLLGAREGWHDGLGERRDAVILRVVGQSTK
ncbi:hypothetical protein ACSSS7_004966 [Eimeria intestinalis]